MQPAFRHADEQFHASIDFDWSPDGVCVVGLTVTEGADQELRSQVVSGPVGLDVVTSLGLSALLDLSRLVRRTTSPFDDLT